MAEYIEREYVLKRMEDSYKNAGISAEAKAKVMRWLKKAPAADMRPVVRGKWEDVEVTYVADKTTLPFERISSMRCNQCNRYHTEIYYYGNPTEMAHFCHNCGAMMEES